jgi:lipoate-protein ligase A
MLNSYLKAEWRLLNTGYADGFTNMAVDEAILLALAEGKSPPTIRFYGWEPPCLSIGYNQSAGDVDVERCREAGVDFVRRPTGGRAILHADELTYSIVLSQDDLRVAGGVVESYRRLSLGLIAGLKSLGINAIQAEEKPLLAPCGKTLACFHAQSAYEIAVDGKKLIGSAQVRKRGCVLQHGALPLMGDVARILDFLKVPEGKLEELRKELRGRATSLELALGRSVAFDDVARTLADGFAKALNLLLVPGVLSEHELALAEELRRGKYATKEWNFQK